MITKRENRPARDGAASNTSRRTDTEHIAYDRLADTLRAHGCGEIRNGKARCPAHDDDKPSLSTGERRDGKGVVINCHAGCDTSDVLAALGLTMADLYDDDTARNIYSPQRDYIYSGGRIVHRKPGKSFPQSGNKNDPSLFHAERIDDADTVYVAEGEKDVEAIELVGGVAVCPPMGAGQKNLARYDWSVLKGKHVIVVRDRDTAGHAHADQVSAILDGIAESVETAEAAVGNDPATISPPTEA